MILIDRDKTVIAGEASIILTEIAAVLDRLFVEVAGKRADAPKYDDLKDKFLHLLEVVEQTRGEHVDFNPQDIVDSPKVKALFHEEFFKEHKGSERRGRSSERRPHTSEVSDAGAEDMLEAAMKKLEDAKSSTEKKKKKKKNKAAKKKDQ